jgi:TadE-like protein
VGREAAVGGRRHAGDRGATLVEFALIAPLLILLLFGIIDFGWAFSQNVDIKNAAREGGRLAAVNAGTGGDPAARRDNLIAQIQARATQLNDGETAIYVALQDDDHDGDFGERGESVVVCIRYPLRSLSGISANFLSGDLTTKTVMRMEQVATFSSGGTTSPAWGTATCTM